MKKLIYIIIIPFLVISILYIAYLQLDYYAPAVNREMQEKTERLLNAAKRHDNRGFMYGSQERIILSPVIWEKNIFDPSRGTAQTVASTVGQPKNIELLGVYTIGKAKGAIIDVKNTYNQYNYQGNHNSSKKKKQKKYYTVGERLPDNFVLQSVGKDYIILSGSGGTTYKISIQYGDESSIKRVEESNKNNVKQQISIIERASQTKGAKKTVDVKVEPVAKQSKPNTIKNKETHVNRNTHKKVVNDKNK